MVPIERTVVYKETLKLAQGNNIEQIRANLGTLGADAKDARLLELFQQMQALQTEIQAHVKLLVEGSPLVNLPPDCLAGIFCNLSLENVFRCFVVCKGLNQTMKTRDFCGRIYQHYFPKHPKPSSLDFYEACRRAGDKNRLKDAPPEKLLDFSRKISNGNIIVHDRFFRMFDHRFEIYDLNTEFLIKSSPNFYKYVKCCALQDKEFYLAGNNSNEWNISAWDSKTGQYLDEFQHTAGDIRVYSLAASSGTLYAGTPNGSILTLDINSRKQLHAVRENGTGVTSLLPFKGKLYSSHSNGMIQIWDLNGPNGPTYEGILSCPENLDESEIKSLVALHRTLCCIYGLREENLRFYDLDTGKCFHIYDEVYTQSLIVFREKFYSAFRKGQKEGIMVWDEKGRCLQTVKVDRVFISDLAISNGNLLSVGYNEIQKWDLTSEYLSLIELAQLFREKNEDKKEESIEKAMEQFSDLPQNVKNEIYGKLYWILRPFQNEYLGCAEHAFHGQYGLSSTAEQRAQAIENYAARDL